MTDPRLAALASAILVPVSVALPTAHADVLLRERVRIEATQNLPGRGMSMDEVESRYGAPAARLAAVGGGSPRQPVIHRWEYADFIVYFERDRVVDTVMKRATPLEIGPKPPRER